MKKTIKWILIVVSSLLIILALVTSIFYFKVKSEMKAMNVLDTKEIAPDIYAIKDSYVNMFLVKDSDNYVAIDAGNDIKVVEIELNKLNIKPEKITAVLLTHTDGDHVAALKLFKNATVYLSKNEEQMINGKTARMMNSHNKIDSKTYTILNDQQTIKIGNLNIKGIMTPGHTPGSMSYLIDGKYLFVGDAFGLKNGKIDKPNKFFSMDMKTAVLSLYKIANLPQVQYIFTGHTGYSNNYKHAMKDWKKIKE
ncbi:MAG: MBL fold metallo-hydrolase [Paludibacter sp.]|nr:MBL fold metallo-hydrolase [Paludibacter sp.]